MVSLPEGPETFEQPKKTRRRSCTSLVWSVRSHVLFKKWCGRVTKARNTAEDRSCKEALTNARIQLAKLERTAEEVVARECAPSEFAAAPWNVQDHRSPEFFQKGRVRAVARALPCEVFTIMNSFFGGLGALCDFRAFTLCVNTDRTRLKVPSVEVLCTRML